MADAAISFLLESISNLLTHNVELVQDVEDKIQWLKDELQRMQCFLKDAAEKQAHDERIRNWVSEIRELAYDAEDAIEIFTLKVDRTARSRGLLPRWVSFPKHLHRRNKLGAVIESIRERLQDMSKFRVTYGIGDLGREGELHSNRRFQEVERWRRLTHWEKDKDVVGLEEDVRLLLKRAILGQRRGGGLSIATIVGMGGIGKSTLARMIYHHPAVAAEFECRAWVVVSSEFTPEDTIKLVMLELQNSPQDRKMLLEDTQKLEESMKNSLGLQEKLLEMLRRQLEGKRYFIVLDDVWEHSHWESLRRAFPNEEDTASRLLITSRNLDVVERAQYVHVMKTLDPDKSWELLLKKAFIYNSDGRCPKDLENIGAEILKKCNGLPFAITVVGAQLAKQGESKSEWEKVLKTMDLSIISPALELSYHKLSPHLKLCFLWLGFFKVGATIRAEKLVEVWIAGGLITREGGETLEETARNYLHMLINQNMVQVKDTSKDDRVKKICHAHDLLHEVSITKAVEEINFEILGQEKVYQPIHKPRHRAIYCSRERLYYSTYQNMYLRSLFFNGVGKVNENPSYWESFELLKVLDFENFGLKNLPHIVGALTGLRYLGLRNNYLKELPSSLGHLKHLKVLDIALNFMVEVPNIIWKMDSLRHLYMSDIICKRSLKIDALKNLQTLTYISVANWEYELSCLQMMTNLRKLGIEELDEHSDVSKLFASLAKLERLDCLNLRGFRFRSMPSLEKLAILGRLTRLKLDGLVTRLPSANNFPPNLAYLTLVNTSLDVDPMPVLERLSKLLYLKLQNAYTGDEMVISNDGFPKLRVMCIGELWHLRNVKVGDGAMPILDRLEINSCPYLESLLEEGSKNDSPPDIAKILYDLTRQKKGKFVELEAEEKYDEIWKTRQSGPSSSKTGVVGEWSKPPGHGHVFGFEGGIGRKHFIDSQAAYKKEFEAKLHEKEEEINNLRRRVEEIESRLARIEDNLPPSDAPPTSGIGLKA